MNLTNELRSARWNDRFVLSQKCGKFVTKSDDNKHQTLAETIIMCTFASNKPLRRAERQHTRGAFFILA